VKQELGNQKKLSPGNNWNKEAVKVDFVKRKNKRTGGRRSLGKRKGGGYIGALAKNRRYWGKSRGGTKGEGGTILSREKGKRTEKDLSGQ